MNLAIDFFIQQRNLKEKELIFKCVNMILVPDSFYEVLKVPTGFRIQICSDPTISTGLKGEKMWVEKFLFRNQCGVSFCSITVAR